MVKHENGSHIYFNESIGDISIHIVILDQKTGLILNYTNGTEIIAPKGIHAIRIEKNNGEYPRLGDLYKQTKVLSGSGANTRNFILRRI